METATRVVWRIFVGVIPEGADLHHRCRHPWCVNPDHLEVLSRTEHGDRHRPGIPTHCKHGHRLDKRNLGIYEKAGRIRWQCKACNRERMRKSTT